MNKASHCRSDVPAIVWRPAVHDVPCRIAAKRKRYADRWFGLLRAPIGIRRRTYIQELADKSWWQNRSLSPISEPRGQFSVAGSGQAADLTGGGVWLAG
jgi:hypothetical protein